MLAAVISLSVAITGAVGLSFYLARQWSGASTKRDKDLKNVVSTSVDLAALRERYDRAMGVIDALKKDNAALESALHLAEESYAELATESIDDAKSPRTANVLRMALSRLDRVRAVVPELPEAEETTPSEDSGENGSLHEPDPGASA